MQAASGQILSVQRVRERRPEQVKNFGIWIRYNSRSGTHNMYKEYRDVTRTGAVSKMFNDMAGRHRARRKSIQIMKVDAVPAKKTRRPGVKQFHNSKLRFALPHRVPRTPRAYRETFVAQRPSTSNKN